MGWGVYAIKRVLTGVGVLFGASVVIFAIIHLVPGDPAQIALGNFASQEQIDAYREHLGLNQPLWVQYVDWIQDILTGDWGRSLINDQSVYTLVAQRYPKSLELAVAALLVGMAISLPLGILGAVKQWSRTDYTAILFSQFGMSVPNFWLGIMLSLIFGRYLGLLPTFGSAPLFEDPVANVKHIILPAVTLGVINAAVFTRYIRSEMLENLNKDYVMTAKAFGHPRRRIIGKYVLKNALIPFVTMIGIQFGWLIGGVVVVEQVFSYSGLGQLILTGLLNRDYTIIQMGLLVLASTYIVANLLVDLVYGWLDPRIKFD